jgi:putative ABC transport system substrate-binding protein
MDRRTFTGLVFGLLAAPVAAQESGKARRIGVLTAGSINNPFFADEMRKHGWIEGRNLIIERRGAEGDAQRVPVLAAELVRLNVEVIVAFGAVASLAAKNATASIPIVATTGDPVVLGLVASLSHPGGNITGVTTIAPELAEKRLELLRTLLPKATRIAELVDPANEYIRRTRNDYEKAFRTLGMQAIFVEVAIPADFEGMFADLSRQRAEAVIVRADPVFLSNRDKIMGLALQRSLPTITEGRRFVAAGGLVSYAPKEAAMFARTAALVNQILHGAKPADLPIEQPAEFELLVNLKTAKALGLAIPQSVLLRADEVIQ